MLKYCFIAAFILLTNMAVYAQSIVVEGKGIDRQSAKTDAFQKAIDNVCGVNILSNKEFRDNVTVHNKLVAYTSCRVKKYDVLHENEDSILLRVEVEKLDSANRFSVRPNQNDQFDQNLTNAIIRSYRDEKITGDQLISELFRDYPYNAYELHKTKSPYIIDDAYRNMYLVVPVDLRWNLNYVNSIREVMSLVQARNGTGTVKIVGKNPKSIFAYTTYHNLNDIKRINDIKSHMTGSNEMKLKISASDSRGTKVLDVCYNPEYKAGGIFYSVGITNIVTIFGSDRNFAEVKIRLQFPADVIYDVYVEVVADRDCKL